jgi:hypothetical protein|tara:strand:+ start:107 stop:286 length:180 start_codon:yes stop_codon:yes gene_type:complete
MDDLFAMIGGFLMWGTVVICEIYGLYLSIQDGGLSFCIALVIPPWAIIKGFLGLLGLIF